MSARSKDVGFHGCYLLVSKNPRYSGRTYIGYTVNPGRRIRQHNSGAKFGGAKKTDGRGPWDMVLIIYGFPNEIFALQFEWAWQHPRDSRRLRGIEAMQKISRRACSLQHCFTTACQLLRHGPWCRLPLNIRWLKPEYRCNLPADCLPPAHMSQSYGPINLQAGNPLDDGLSADDVQEAVDQLRTAVKMACCECREVVEATSSLWSACYHSRCNCVYHLQCLAKHWNQQDDFERKGGQVHSPPHHLVPVSGCCPKCCNDLLWGNVVRWRQRLLAAWNESDTQSTSKFSRMKKTTPASDSWTTALRSI